MKKILLVAINSKYIHSNLALKYLKAYYNKYKTTNHNIKILELTINNSLDYMLSKIYNEKSDYILFSTYIWNVECVMKLSKELKKISSKLKIALGGPEVSYNSQEILKKNNFIDYIFTGEGEKIFYNFLENDFKNTKGIYYRKDNVITFDGYEHHIENLDEIPFPYNDNDFLNNKIIYYESTRGCPFSCSYCISSIDKRMRAFSINRVKSDLKVFIDNKVRLVKFVDRTYNLSKEHYLTIWMFLVENYTHDTKFHFEISGDLFDDEVISFLNTIPHDYFQFEIGVQTTNDATLEAIDRKTDLVKLKENVLKIGENIHLHLDLIAGLPKEDYETFKKSFNFVYSMKPDMIQLGFLKILKGTKISTEIIKYGYKYKEYPPYEVISNNYITYDEILKLKNIEVLVNIYYNSDQYDITLNYLLKKLYGKNYFKLFEDLSEHWEENNYYDIGHKPIKYFEYLYTFFIDKKGINQEIFLDCLKFDFLKMGKPGYFPKWLSRNTDKKEYETIITEAEFNSKREGYKNTEFEIFKYNIFSENYDKFELKILFNYKIKNITIL